MTTFYLIYLCILEINRGAVLNVAGTTYFTPKSLPDKVKGSLITTYLDCLMSTSFMQLYKISVLIQMN